MNRLCFLMAFILCCNLGFSQGVNLEEMKESKRIAYLKKKSKEVIMNFGPSYYRKKQKPSVSQVKEYDPEGSTHPIKIQNEGRKYYRVTYTYDKTEESMPFWYAAEVDIWADTGEPVRVNFGNGMGKTFLARPYDEWVKEGIKEEDKNHWEKKKPNKQ